MPKQHLRKKRRTAPKRVLRLPDLDQAKSAVVNSLSSVDAQRGYTHAIDEFVEWHCSEPRLSFNRTVVLRYRIHLACFCYEIPKPESIADVGKVFMKHIKRFACAHPFEFAREQK